MDEWSSTLGEYFLEMSNDPYLLLDEDFKWRVVNQATNVENAAIMLDDLEAPLSLRAVQAHLDRSAKEIMLSMQEVEGAVVDLDEDSLDSMIEHRELAEVHAENAMDVKEGICGK